jgi:hypothetical protein
MVDFEGAKSDDELQGFDMADFNDEYFTRSVFNHTEKISHEDKYRNTIDANMESKSDELIIANCKIDKLTEVVASMTWVTKLTVKNSDLKSIENLPPNLVELVVICNSIPHLDGSMLPSTLKLLIWIKNYTKTIVDLREGIVELIIKDNLITELCAVPSTVKQLCLTDNSDLGILPSISEGCEKIDLNCTAISNIDGVPDSCIELHTYRCKIPIVNKLPANLKIWKAYISEISAITCEWPLNLVEADLFKNELSYVPDFPPFTETVDLEHNNLKTIPKFPSTVLNFNIRNNHLLHISEEFRELYSRSPNVLFDEPSRRHTTSQIMFNPGSGSEMMWRFTGNGPIQFAKRDKTLSNNRDNPHYIPLTRVFTV